MWFFQLWFQVLRKLWIFWFCRSWIHAPILSGIPLLIFFWVSFRNFFCNSLRFFSDFFYWRNFSYDSLIDSSRDFFRNMFQHSIRNSSRDPISFYSWNWMVLFPSRIILETQSGIFQEFFLCFLPRFHHKFHSSFLQWLLPRFLQKFLHWYLPGFFYWFFPG